MNIRIICIGKLKKDYWGQAAADYEYRLNNYCNFSVTELPNAIDYDNASPAQIEAVKNEEGEMILKAIKDKEYVITLEIEGKQLSSEELADKINDFGINGISDIAFVIGGSRGLSKDVSRRANYKLSFSKMTFPHKFIRIILMEQIYRGFKIIHNEPYHK